MAEAKRTDLDGNEEFSRAWWQKRADELSALGLQGIDFPLEAELVDPDNPGQEVYEGMKEYAAELYIRRSVTYPDKKDIH